MDLLANVNEAILRSEQLINQTDEPSEIESEKYVIRQKLQLKIELSKKLGLLLKEYNLAVEMI
ncbi:MAG: hypothetical protein MUE85_02190 [Microscillaceae bacterium]|nr:hypothetical protein [Microscillaceae bacterium]